MIDKNSTRIDSERYAMRILSAVIAITIFLLSVTHLRAQTNRITHTITTQPHAAPTFGRHLWFTLLTNYDYQAGKYYALYVSSPKATKVNISLNGDTKIIVLQPNVMATFTIPSTWEIQSSAIVGPFGIHVWSDDADISGYLMSHNSSSCDGTYLIPTIGWSTDYVVAAYNAIFEGFSTTVYDYPSEMAIVAAENNTVCTITPTTDIRLESSDHACCSCLAHAAGVPFTEILQAGEAVKYRSTCTKDAENYDFSGTIVHSTKPVGVLGGVQLTNIPMDYPYGSTTFEMVPPVRTWGTTYYTAPFYSANSAHWPSTFLVIGSKAGQEIFRDDAAVGLTQYCTLGAQYETNWNPTIDQASRWTSSDPFLLVQYTDGQAYGPGATAGAPTQVVINPVEQFAKSVTFSVSADAGFTNYVNLIVNDSAFKSTKLDGQSIASNPRTVVDNIYSVVRVNGVKQGTHVVQSDSAVGVYVYGLYGSEAYSWSGTYGTATVKAADTIPPAAITTGSCYTSHVALRDSGGIQSKLNFIRMDTESNMTYTFADSNWLEGSGRNSSFYDMSVIDISKPAYLQVSVFDVAGNVTTVKSTYQPQTAKIAPAVHDFGIGHLSGTPTCLYDSIINNGTVPFTFTELRLINSGSSGFSIVKPDTTPLAVGERRAFEICFIPQIPTTAYDTIIFGDGCSEQRALVYGTGGGADFRITSYDFGSHPLGDTVYNPSTGNGSNIEIVNLSKTSPITIDSIWADSTEFTYLNPRPFPLLLQPGSDTIVSFRFRPTYCGGISSSWHAKSNSVGPDGKQLGVRNAKLQAYATCDDVESSATQKNAAQLVISDNGRTARAIVPTNWTQPLTLEIENVLGIRVFSSPVGAAASVRSTETEFDLTTFPSGAYFYRMTSGSEIATGKIVIQK